MQARAKKAQNRRLQQRFGERKCVQKKDWKLLERAAGTLGTLMIIIGSIELYQMNLHYDAFSIVFTFGGLLLVLVGIIARAYWNEYP